MQTDIQKRETARRYTKQVFADPATTANLDLNHVKAAIDVIDSVMDTTVGGKTVKQHLIGSLPEPFKTRSTAAQKALALSLWAQQEAGLI